LRWLGISRGTDANLGGGAHRERDLRAAQLRSRRPATDMALTRTGSGAWTDAQNAAGALLLTLALASACTPTPEVRSVATDD